MTERIADKLAIDGGPPVAQREMNRYKGAAVIGEEEKAAVMEVLDSQSLFRYYGPICAPKWLRSRRHSRPTSAAASARPSTSGTAALRLGLAGLGVGPGDEVIVPAVTFIASVGAIVASRARPIFAEIDETMQLDPADLARCLSPRTKAIMPVHLDGVSVDMDAVMGFAREHGLTVIEDAAQSCGSLYKGKPVGTIGDVGCFSFQLEKNITSGEGGILVTDDPEVYRRAVIYSDQGGQFWTSHAGVRDTVGGQPVIGENLRMSEIAGAILGCQVAKLPGILDRIEANTAAVREAVADARRRHAGAGGSRAGSPRHRRALLSADGGRSDALGGGVAGRGHHGRQGLRRPSGLRRVARSSTSGPSPTDAPSTAQPTSRSRSSTPWACVRAAKICWARGVRVNVRAILHGRGHRRYDCRRAKSRAIIFETDAWCILLHEVCDKSTFLQ